MKMRKNIELIAILMAVLAACLFTACNGGAMEELWKDELENGNVPVSERIVTDEGAVIISETFEIQRNAEQEVTIAASPANVTGQGDDSVTTISFPAGSFGSSGKTVTETINVVVYQTPVAAAKFTVSSESAIAGLDLTVTVNDVPVQHFNNQVVKVTTYVAKNLTHVGIHYEDETWTQVAQETDVDATHEFYYESTTGKLVFATTHFSQFLLSANEVAYVEGNNTAYLNLNAAITSATNDDTILILKDTLVNNKVMIDKDLTIDLNKKILSNNFNSGDRLFEVDGYNLTISNGNLVIPNSNTNTYGFIKVLATVKDTSISLLNVSLQGNTNNGAFIKAVTNEDDNEKKIVIKMIDCTGNSNNHIQYCDSLYGAFELIVTGGTYSSGLSPFAFDSYAEGSFGVFENVTAESVEGPIIESAGNVISFKDCNFNIIGLHDPGFYSTTIGASWDSVISIDGGSYSSDFGAAIEIYSTGGSFNITNGLFSGATAAIRTYDNCDSIINISGGSFFGVLDVNHTDSDVSITGGTFSSDPTDYVAEGYKAVDNGNGTWTVSPQY